MFFWSLFLQYLHAASAHSTNMLLAGGLTFTRHSCPLECTRICCAFCDPDWAAS